MVFRWTIWLVLFFSLISCERKTGEKEGRDVPVIDTNNAEHTYEQLKNQPAKQRDSLYNGICNALVIANKFPLAFSHLKYYGKIAGDIPRVRALSALMNGYYYSKNAKKDSGDVFFRQAVDLYQKLKMAEAVATAYSGLIGNLLFRNDYTNALSYQYKALAIYEQLGDSSAIYAVKTHMVTVLKHLGDLDKAEAILASSLQYYERAGSEKDIAYVNASFASFHQKQYEYEEALQYANKALHSYQSLNNREEIARMKNLIASVYYSQKKWKEAKQYFQESLALVPDKRQIQYIQYNLAGVYESLGQQDSALRIYQTLISDPATDGKNMAKSHFELSKYYAGKQQYAQALEHHKQFKEWTDSIYSIEKTRALNELNIQYETEKNKEVIQRLSSERRADQLRKLSYLLALGLTVTTSMITVLFLGNRNKKHRQRLLETETKLASNQYELKLFTEKFLSKNKLVEELELKLHQLETKPTADTGEYEEQLSELYQFKILTENDWREFKILFDKVHPSLITRLRSQYPDLAPAEERQFLLTRLNIATKECADMLGISMQGVKKNRYRLKKRFALSEQDDLDDFVKAF